MTEGIEGLWLHSLSPDGKRALVSIKNGPMNLFTVSLEDGLLSNLTDSDGFYAYPSWSPDGQAVSFTLSAGPVSNIMRVNVDGSGLTRLTRDGISVAPKWSPDGHSIAFLRRYSYDKAHIYLMAADGSDVRQLTNGGDERIAGEVADGWMENMAWSPDGQYLAFSRAVFDPRWSWAVSGAMYLLHIPGGEWWISPLNLSRLLPPALTRTTGSCMNLPACLSAPNHSLSLLFHEQ